MDCGDWGKHAYLTELPAALKTGQVVEADLDRALVRLTKLQMDLGLFDAKENQQYFHFGLELINSEEHIRHALEAAQQAIVCVLIRNPPLQTTHTPTHCLHISMSSGVIYSALVYVACRCCFPHTCAMCA